MATQQAKRAAFRTILGGVSVLTGYGAFYSFTKYIQQASYWNKVNSQIQDFAPVEITGNNAVTYPWLQNGSIQNWEYKVVKIRGFFKQERFFVQREREGKSGYLVFAPFVTSVQKLDPEAGFAHNPQTENSIFVNLGWVPTENKGDIEMSYEPTPLEEVAEHESDIEYDQHTGLINDPEPLIEDDAFQLTEITALVRRGEQQDILNGRRNWPNQGVFQYIDLDYMSRFFRVYNLDANRTAYLERIVPDYEEEDQEMYPVPASKQNFEKPIQTPGQYLQNSFLFGATSGLSIVSILTFLKR